MSLFYCEDMLSKFNSLLEADEAPATEPKSKPVKAKVTFDPAITLTDEQAGMIVQALVDAASKRPNSDNVLVKYFAAYKPKSKTDTDTKGKSRDKKKSGDAKQTFTITAGDLTVTLVPGVTAAKAKLKVKATDGNEYPMLAKYDKAGKKVDLALQAIATAKTSKLIDDCISADMTTEAKSSVFHKVMTSIIHDEGSYHMVAALTYKWPTHTISSNTNPNPNPNPNPGGPDKQEPPNGDEPDEDILKVDEIIQWACNPDYIGKTAFELRPTPNDKADVENETERWYSQIISDYVEALENDSDLSKAKAIGDEPQVDDPDKLKEWIRKVLTINNELPPEECVSEPHERGEYIIKRLNGEGGQQPQQPTGGEGNGNGTGDGQQRILGDDIIDFAMKNNKFLGTMAKDRARYGDKFGAGAGNLGYHLTKERAIFNDNQGDLDNRMKFGERQGQIKLGVDRGQFVRKWYPELIKEYSAATNQPNLQVDDESKRLVARWLANSAPIRDYVYSVYDAINTMVWDELSSNVEERGKFLHDRILGYGKEDLRNNNGKDGKDGNGGKKHRGIMERLGKFKDLYNDALEYETKQNTDGYV